jgi:hypothetical protein
LNIFTYYDNFSLLYKITKTGYSFSKILPEGLPWPWDPTGTLAGPREEKRTNIT